MPRSSPFLIHGIIVIMSLRVTDATSILGPENNSIEDEDSPDSDGFIPFDHGFSNKDYDIVCKQKHPINSQWKDVEGPKVSNVSATIDRACQTI